VERGFSRATTIYLCSWCYFTRRHFQQEHGLVSALRHDVRFWVHIASGGSDDSARTRAGRTLELLVPRRYNTAWNFAPLHIDDSRLSICDNTQRLSVIANRSASTQ
jgi:hypothetical protein